MSQLSENVASEPIQIAVSIRFHSVNLRADTQTDVEGERIIELNGVYFGNFRRHQKNLKSVAVSFGHRPNEQSRYL
jgi:hypothetical protein